MKLNKERKFKTCHILNHLYWENQWNTHCHVTDCIACTGTTQLLQASSTTRV